jgi:hypothetical protein
MIKRLVLVASFIYTITSIHSLYPTPKTLCQAFDQYTNDFDTLDGWFEKPFLQILKAINAYQVEHNIEGNLGEIGVYHGKSLIPLCLLSQENELTLAVDCFDDQQYNYDLSGMGCTFDKFSANIAKYCSDKASNLVVYRCDSSKATSEEYLAKVNNKKFRIFSIDGCHRAEETYTDLHNVHQALQEGGVIIIDDYFNKDWPGVSNGVSKYLYECQNLRPFFIGFNKLLLAHPNYAEIYFDYLRNLIKPKKDAIIFDTPVLIYE